MRRVVQMLGPLFVGSTAAFAAIEGTSWLPIGPAPLHPGQAPTCASCGVDAAGRASALAVNPADSLDVWLGTSNGGVWHSVAGGAANSWRPLSDDQASLAIGAIALDGCNANGCSRIYAGTGENVIRRDTYYGAGLLVGTINGPFEVSWSLRGASDFAPGAIHNVILDPSTNGPNKRIYVSLSSGATASSVQATLSAPAPPGGYGLYRSEDDGASWQKLDVPGSAGKRPTDLEIHPQDPNVLFAAFFDTGMFKGIRNPMDDTISWCPLNPGLGVPPGCPDPVGSGLPAPGGLLAFDHVELSIWAADPAVMYAAFGHCPDPLLGNCEPSVYRSTDGGVSWTERFHGNDQHDLYDSGCPRAYSRYTHGLTIHPQDPEIVYLSALRLCRSANGAQSFSSQGSGKLHYDIHSVVFPDPEDPLRIYTTSDGGFASSSNGGSTWTGGNVGLQTAGFQSISFSKLFGADEIIGGTQDNGPLMWTGGSTWERINDGDSGSTLMDLEDKKVFYDIYFRLNIRRSDDFGGSWDPKTTGIFPDSPSAFYPPLEQGPTAPYPLYFGATRLFRSLNRGNNWSTISPDLGGEEYFDDIGMVNVITAIAVARTDPDRIYLGFYDGQVWRTSDDPLAPCNAGACWEQIDAGLPDTLVTSIDVDTLDEDRAYVTFSGFGIGAHVYKTINGGAGWTAASGPDPGNPNDAASLPDLPANMIQIEPGAPARLWLGTDRGVYKSLDSGATWTRFGTGMPNVPVYDLAVDAQRQRVFAATHGRGVFFLGGPNVHTSEACNGDAIENFGIYGYGFPAGGNCTVTLMLQDGQVCAQGTTDGRGHLIQTDDDGKLVSFDPDTNDTLEFAWGCYEGSCVGETAQNLCEVPANPLTTVVAQCGGKTGNAQVAGCPLQTNPTSTLFDFDGGPGPSGPNDFVLAGVGKGGGGGGPDGFDQALCSARVPVLPADTTLDVLTRARDIVNASESCGRSGLTAGIHAPMAGEDAPSANDTTLFAVAPGVTAEQLFTAVDVARGQLTGSCFSIGRLGRPLDNALLPTRLTFKTGAAGAAGGSLTIVENAQTGSCRLEIPTFPRQLPSVIAREVARRSLTDDTSDCPSGRNPRDLRVDGDSIVATLASRLTVCVNDPGVGFSLRPEGVLNIPPVADAGPDTTVECAGPSGTPITLNGGASIDPDSSAGTSDIVSFEWFENFETPAEVLLGTGPVLTVPYASGVHDVTLRLTDSVGHLAFDKTVVTVADSQAPALTLDLDAAALYPPNHRLVPVSALVAATDQCGSAAVTLVSIASTEPDDAPGDADGATSGDIRDALPGQLDLDFLLRAERDAGGGGRSYEVIFRAQDAAGNDATATVSLVVPLDPADPLDNIMLERGSSGTVVRWSPVAGALHYNVIRGNLASLGETADEIQLGGVSCIEAASTDTESVPDVADPASGGVFFYLVEYDDGQRRGYGTESAPKPRIPGPGDCP